MFTFWTGIRSWGACCSARDRDCVCAGPRPGESASFPLSPADLTRDGEFHKQTLSFLSNVLLFKRLPKDQQTLLAAACIPIAYDAGQTLVRQGDVGSEFYLIQSGEAVVNVQKGRESPLKVATLKAGNYFGENALLKDEPRSATIVAQTRVVALKIMQRTFQELGLHEQIHTANRNAIGGSGFRDIETKPPLPKTEKERTLITDAIRSNPNLRMMASLDNTRVQQLVDVAWKETVPRGTELIREGDLLADYFYVVQEGWFEVFVDDQGDKARGATEVLSPRRMPRNVGTVKRGGSFGELALMYLAPRQATIKAVSDSVVWVIDRANFKDILMTASAEQISEYVAYLKRIQVLDSLRTEEKEALAQALVDMHYAKGEAILQQGEVGDSFHILYEGEVGISKDRVQQCTLSANLSIGMTQVFGEQAFLNNDPTAASVVVISETAKALMLDRSSFELALGRSHGLISRTPYGEDDGVMKARPRCKTRAARHENVLFQDLARIGLLGCGGFGTVELCEDRRTGEIYALKGISKGYIVKMGLQVSVMNEKTVMAMLSSAFIIELFAAYNESQALYFLLEPALGGELHATYKRKDFYGSDKHAQYYTAGVVFALEHCHGRRIIHRDLKPENLLLTERGHVKLADMGVAKFVVGKTYTTCGTPEYLAPEMISHTGHTIAVDWWSFGILFFELLTGNPPFQAKHPMKIYTKVMKGMERVVFPLKCGAAAELLIRGLLKQDPSQRFPMRKGGIKNVQLSRYFKGFDWEAMRSLRLEPPYKPVVKSKTDLSNFSAREEKIPMQIPYTDEGTGWDKNFAL